MGQFWGVHKKCIDLKHQNRDPNRTPKKKLVWYEKAQEKKARRTARGTTFNEVLSKRNDEKK